MMARCTVFQYTLSYCGQMDGPKVGFKDKLNWLVYVRGGLEVKRWSDNRLHFALVGSNPV